MKIPIIEYPQEGSREDYIIFLPGEADPIINDNCIWCYSKKQVNNIVDYFLKHGYIKVKYIGIWGAPGEKNYKLIKKFDMGKKSYPSRKMWIVKKVGRVRKRPKKTGGNIKEGDLWSIEKG